jgi:hypothetical protein
MSSKSKLAWFFLFILTLASIGSNMYLIKIVLDLQSEVNLANRKTERALEIASDVQSQYEATNGKAGQALTVANDIQSQIDATTVMAGVAIDYVAQQLKALETEKINFKVSIDQQIPIAVSVPFNDEFYFPLDMNIPINTSVNIPVQIGLLGSYDLDIPINTSIPFKMDIVVPVNEQVDIDTIVPIKMDFPVSISVQDIPIAGQLTEWRVMLEQFSALQKDNSPADASALQGLSGNQTNLLNTMLELLKSTPDTP